MSGDPATYDARFFPALAEMERRHFWYAARRRAVAAALSGTSGTLPEGDVLEVGCGAGGMLEVLRDALPPRRVVGLDLLAPGLAHARRRTGVPLVAGDASRAPFRGSFALVALFDVIEHLDDDRAALRQAAALLKPGGHLLVTVPAGPALWSYFDEAARHRRRYTEATLAEALSAAALVPMLLTPFMAAYLPLVWLARRARRVPDAAERTNRDLSPPGLLNAPLGWLTRFEPALLRRGRRLPFGTSLLAIARRRAP